jgi:hypothetical protein
MALGLDISKHFNWRHCKHHCNVERFRQAYGVTPKSVAQVWHLLRTSSDLNCKLPMNADPMHLLLAIRFLWRYEVYEDLGRFFGIKSPKTVKRWVMYYLPRVARLLASMIPDWHDAYIGLYFFFTIDGTHCPIQEPSPFSTQWSSHKLGGAPGLNYEIAIRIDKFELLWLNGPTPPGLLNDISVFQSKLLKKIQSFTADNDVAFKGIGDKGYRGEAEYISTRNDLDPEEISEFKNRALARHETFNQKLKMFAVLRDQFRHELDFHSVDFESVVVLTLVQLSNGGLSIFDAYPI